MRTHVPRQQVTAASRSLTSACQPQGGARGAGEAPPATEILKTHKASIISSAVTLRGESTKWCRESRKQTASVWHRMTALVQLEARKRRKGFFRNGAYERGCGKKGGKRNAVMYDWDQEWQWVWVTKRGRDKNKSWCKVHKRNTAAGRFHELLTETGPLFPINQYVRGERGEVDRNRHSSWGDRVCAESP